MLGPDTSAFLNQALLKPSARNRLCQIKFTWSFFSIPFGDLRARKLALSGLEAVSKGVEWPVSM